MTGDSGAHPGGTVERVKAVADLLAQRHSPDFWTCLADVRPQELVDIIQGDAEAIVALLDGPQFDPLCECGHPKSAHPFASDFRYPKTPQTGRSGETRARCPYEDGCEGRGCRRLRDGEGDCLPSTCRTPS